MCERLNLRAGVWLWALLAGVTCAQAIVAEEVRDNRFLIKTDKPDVKVSWQVTGGGRDAWAERHRVPVEQEIRSRRRRSRAGTHAGPRRRFTQWFKRKALHN